MKCVRPAGKYARRTAAFAGWLDRTPADRIAQKREEAERAFHRVGITFAVYGEEAGSGTTHSRSISSRGSFPATNGKCSIAD